MKNVAFQCLFLLLWISTGLFGQSVPQRFNYQSIIRDEEGQPLANEATTLEFMIHDATLDGTVIYKEKHVVITNAFGLVNVVIGQGSDPQGDFSAIDWGENAKYLSVALETTPGNFENIGGTQLLSVPYALYALKADASKNGGTLWVVGTELPTNAIGEDGNLYLRTTTGDFFQKIAGTWVMQGTLRGPQGDKGEQGIAGIQGLKGDKGDTGATGAQGLKGDKGDTGATGLQGLQGIPGLKGDKGDTGATGAQGLKGDKGDTGATGLQGLQGIQGLKGDKGDTGASGAQGLKGDKGDTGATGLQGLQGIQGLKGDKGDTGTTGPQGLKGDKGDTGATGPQGLQGISGLKGDKGDTGATGAQGLKGDKGDKGDPGSAGSYTSGTGISIVGNVISNTGDTDATDDLTNTTPAGGDLSGTFGNLQLKPGVVTTPEILDRSVTGAKIASQGVTSNEIANGTIIAIDLADMGATNGQVLKWNSTTQRWTPSADNTGGSGGGSSFLPCGQLDSPSAGEKVSIGVCPDNDAQLTIATDDLSTGLDVDVNNGNAQALRVAARNGSGDNDAVALLSRSQNSDANGVLMAVSNAGNNADAFGMNLIVGNTNIDNIDEVSSFSDGNGSDQNYGLYIDLRDRSNNNSAGHTQRDVGIYVKNQNDSDYAAYFDGDVAIPREIEFLRSNGTQWAIGMFETNNLALRFNSNNNIGVFSSTNGVYTPASDRRLKENITGLRNMLPIALQLQPMMYNFIADESKQQTIGLIAQDVEKLLPELVHHTPDETLGDMLTLNYDGLSAVAIQAIKEQQQIIEEQKATIDNQESRITALEEQMAALKGMLLQVMANNPTNKKEVGKE